MKRTTTRLVQQWCHSRNSTACFHPNNRAAAMMFSSNAMNQVIGDLYDKGNKNVNTSSTTSGSSSQQKDQQFNPSKIDLSSPDKSATAIRKDKETESSFFDTSNPIPNVNTTEKMANKNPMGSYSPGSYVAGSSTADIPSPNVGKSIDKDPSGFYGFDNEIKGQDLYTTKEATDKALGIDKDNQQGWKGSSNKDQWSETKDQAKSQWKDTKEQVKDQWSDTKEKVKDQWNDTKEQVKKNVSTSSDNWTSGYDDTTFAAGLLPPLGKVFSIRPRM